MKTPKSLILTITALACAASTHAAVVVTVNSEDDNDGGSGYHSGTISSLSDDLLETQGSIFSASDSPASGIGGQHIASSLIQGDIAIGNTDEDITDPDDPDAVFAAAAGESIRFDLNTTTNTLGYDLTSIATYSYWQDSRARQAYTVKYSVIGSAIYTILLEVGDSGENGKVNEVVLTENTTGILATGVDSILFEFEDAATNWTPYREIDVTGTATAIPEPSVTLLGTLGALLLFRRRRS